MSDDSIVIVGAPRIRGLGFRHFRGESDFHTMAAVIAASAGADHLERADRAEDIASAYAHLSNCDPRQDMIFAEVNGEVVGYSRGWWQQEENGPRLYCFVGFMVPEWRRKGIGRALLRWTEERLRAVAQDHPREVEKFFQAMATEYETGMLALVKQEGYQPVRHFWDMVRPSLEDIPDFPLPAGVELRSVTPEHYRAIWDASNEAFRDHWGYSEPGEDDYQAWLENKHLFQPQLWQVAWDISTGEVVGQVRTYIDDLENEKFARRRGYTEFISVARPWRRRGLARALIVRSLAAQRAQGMTESALGVDSENLSGATRVYEDCGFRVTRTGGIYRKAL